MMCVFIYAHFTVEYSVKVDLLFNKYLIHFMWYHCIYARSKTRNGQHVRTFCLQKLHIICVIIVILSPLLKSIHVQVICIFYENVISLQSVVYLQE